MIKSKDGAKIQQTINPVQCAAAMIKSKDGAKILQTINPVQCAAAMIKSKDGAKPQKEYSPGQRPGYKCTYYSARCKRKRSQRNARSFLPVALSERKLLHSMLPRALPWANFLLGFQPVFAACKHFVQGKATEFQAK
ncbi:hypothetical protein [Hoylesella timonensis]|uniref:hypothetical protein n=1 Tax=Hoylesella timonensis TaxID=386414 RepID=UPI0015E0D595|nr:hypothetical protein [Hoylesella timonensis]